MRSTQLEHRAAAKPTRKWPLFGILLAASLSGSLLLIPYSMSLLAQTQTIPVPIWAVAIGSLIQNLILSSIAIGIGLWLGASIGLGAPVLGAWLAGDAAAPRRWRAALPIAIGLGLAAGAIVLLISFGTARLWPALQPDVTHPPPWQGLLAAIGAGITEEIWLRLELMTLIAWAGTKLAGKEQVGAGVAWASIVLAALIFGTLHLPLAAALMGLSLPVVAWVLVANGLVGMVFGWLYWQRGLLAAMVAHFATDVVLHVLAPGFGLLS